MASAPRWRDNSFRKFDPSDGVLATREDWTTWTLSSGDKLDAMDCEFFIPAAEALSLVNDKFDYFVNHPNPDVFTTPQFKKAVITYMVAHGFVFPIDADNINPSSDAKFLRNYNVIIKVLKAIQSQLSDSCAETFESIFTTESLDKHQLKPLRVWKRMKDSVHKVAKDRGSYMTSLQHHAGIINSWELDDVDAWIKRTEILRQDLLRVGYAESIADDCMSATC